MKIEEFTNNSKYTRWYISIIRKAQARASTRSEAKRILGNCEGHHVIPRSIWKDKANTELAYLTTKEHFVVHHLLVNMTSGSNRIKMVEAIMQFSQGRALTAKQAAICLNYKHSPCSDQRKASISAARLNTAKEQCIHCLKFVDPGNYRRFHGDNCNKNPDMDLQVLENRKALNRASVIKSIQNGTHKTGNPNLDTPIECPHCKKLGRNLPVMKRFHFERCKHRVASAPLPQT